MESTIAKFDSEIDNYSRISESNTQREKSLENFKHDISVLKSIPSDNDRFETIRKAQSIKEFNDKLERIIEETKRFSTPNNKLEEIDHSGYNTVKLGSDFIPKNIDEILLIWEWTKSLKIDACYQAREIAIQDQLNGGVGPVAK